MSPNERLVRRARNVVAKPEADMPSPCVSVCKMNSATELCLGCFRTLDEIALWGRMDDGSKLEVWRSIPERVGHNALTPTLATPPTEEDT